MVSRLFKRVHLVKTAFENFNSFFDQEYSWTMTTQWVVPTFLELKGLPESLVKNLIRSSQRNFIFLRNCAYLYGIR